MSDVSFEAKPGSVVAFVGESGSGKTTIFNLLERFYDPLQGAVIVNGADIRTYDPPSLRTPTLCFGKFSFFPLYFFKIDL